MTERLGDFVVGDTVWYFWPTNDGSGGSVDRTVNGTLSVYKEDNLTQNTSGITDTEAFDSLTGVHVVEVDTSADLAFYEYGYIYTIVLSASTIDGQTVNHPLASFRLVNKPVSLSPTFLAPPTIQVANTKTWRLGAFLGNSGSDLPDDYILCPGNIAIDRSPKGNGAWSSAVAETALTADTLGALVYRDEVFDSTPYVDGDDIRTTLKYVGLFAPNRRERTLDFETGGVVGDHFDTTSGSNLSINSISPISGTYDFKISPPGGDTTARYGRLTFPKSFRGSWAFQFDFNINGLTMADGDTVQIVQVSGTGWNAWLDLNRSGSNYRVQAKLYHDGGTVSSSTGYITFTKSATQSVTIIFKRATSATASDAAIFLLLNGQLAGQATGADHFDRAPTTYCLIGFTNGLDTGTSGDIQFDNIKFLFGSLIEVSGPNGVQLFSHIPGGDKTGYSLAATGLDAVVIENSKTLPQMIRGFWSVLTRKSSGGGTTTIAYRDDADTKDRFTYTIDANNNRTFIVEDLN